VIEVPRADRQDRPVYIGKDIFSNPGVFRVNKAVAVEGGTSDARNSHIFNIFALVDIGERSGMGLADLYGHWKKHGLPEPVISEEYDPDRVKITVYTDSDQDPANRPKSAPKTAQSVPKVPQIDPTFAHNRPKLSQQSAQGKTVLSRVSRWNLETR
jgi:predicted HTH transcriptional regulator